MNGTERVIITIAKALVTTCIIIAKVMIALLSVGSESSTNRGRKVVQTQGVYPKVRGYRQTKGFWSNQGPMGGRTHERYRHGH